MSFQTTTCVNMHTYEYYGSIVQPCPECGWPNVTTGDAYYRSMGIETEPTQTKTNQPTKD